MGQSLTMSHGALSIFLQRPVSVVLLAIAFLMLFGPVLLRRFRRFVARPTTTKATGG